jgi:ubiquinone/menaquinone biosynthesis C-methylase UbiE
MSAVETIKYYNQIGSRVGYKLVAGGHRHFGYYGKKNYWYIPHAAEAMIDHLAEYADIKLGNKVLDAGCGEGRASLRIAEEYGASVTGIDLVPRSIKVAKSRAKKTKARLRYELADYNKLPYADGTFDVVFTLETFTHSPDPEKTLKEFWRVLKPGGRIVIFDYSIKDLKAMPAETRLAVENIAKYTDCPSFITITHDYYKKNLPRMGMIDFEVLDQTDAVMRSLAQIYVLSWLPYQLLKLFRRVDHHPNLLISHFAKPGAKNDLF